LVKKKRELQEAESEVAELVSQLETKFGSHEELYEKLKLRNEYSSRVMRMKQEQQQLQDQIQQRTLMFVFGLEGN